MSDLLESGLVHPSSPGMAISLTVRPQWYTFVLPGVLTLGCLLTLEELFSTERDKALTDPVVYLALALLVVPVLLVRYLPQAIRLQNSGIGFRYFLWPERIILWGGLERISAGPLRRDKLLGRLTVLTFTTRTESVTILGPPFYDCGALYAMIGKRTGRQVVVTK